MSTMLYPFHIRLTKIWEDIIAGRLNEAEKGLREHLNSGPVGVRTAEGLFIRLVVHCREYHKHLLSALNILEQKHGEANESERLVFQAIKEGRTVMGIIKEINEELKEDLDV